MKKWLTSSQFDNGQTSRFSIFTIFLMIKLHPKILQEHSHSFRFNFTNIEANIWAKSFHERFCKNSSQCREILLQVKYAMASFGCYDNSDVIVFLIMTNFHLYPIKLWWQFFQMFVYDDVVILRIGRHWALKTVTVSSHRHMSLQPMLLHRMALFSCRLYVSLKFGQLAKIFWANRLPPPLAKISRTPMVVQVQGSNEC